MGRAADVLEFKCQAAALACLRPKVGSDGDLQAGEAG
ncbi:MAG: hypothetical protein JWR79_376 [Tardiphaga sp.]|nr:hypothetical protein [Tardiphaga sp.]